MRERREDLPLECLVVGEGGLAVGGAEQDRESELGGSGSVSSPAEAIRGVRGAGEVDLAGAPNPPRSRRTRW